LTTKNSNFRSVSDFAEIEVSNMKGLEIRIFGRVQGVSFRFFTKRKAIKYNIRGYVMNLPDGSVKTVAVGDEKNLDKFISELRIGPALARVDKIEINEIITEEFPENFQIRYY